MLQLAPNLACARGNTIIQQKAYIPGRTAAEWLIIALTELLDRHGVLPHRSTAWIKYQAEISC